MVPNLPFCTQAAAKIGQQFGHHVTVRWCWVIDDGSSCGGHHVLDKLGKAAVGPKGQYGKIGSLVECRIVK